MSEQYIRVRRDWLEGLLEKADNVDLARDSDELALSINVAALLGYISSAKHILELEDYKQSLEKTDE